MNSSIIRNLGISFGLSILLLLVTSIASFVSINELLHNSSLVENSNIVVKNSNSLLSQLKDAETGQRGFLLSGDEKFLAPYHMSSAMIPIIIRRLRERTKAKPVELAQLEELEKLIAEVQSVFQAGILSKRASKELDTFELERGRRIMDRIRERVLLIQQKEKESLVKSVANKKRLSTYTPVLILVAGCFSLFLSAMFFLRIKKSIKQTLVLQAELKIQGEETIQRIKEINSLTRQIAEGRYSIRIEERDNEGLNQLAHSLNKLAEQLQKSFETLTENESLQTKLVELSRVMEGEMDMEDLTGALVEHLSLVTESQAVALYLCEQGEIRLTAVLGAEIARESFRIGDGLVGACAKTGNEIFIEDVVESQIVVSHAMGQVRPGNLLLVPVIYEKEVIGVMEFASIKNFTRQNRLFITECVAPVARAIRSAQNRLKVFNLLLESQDQQEELQVQTEELRMQADELTIQAEHLQVLNEKLLKQTEKEAQARLDAEESKMIAEKASSATSNFLAVMSHEIRTPMNGVLGMSALLADTMLTDEQREYVNIINTSGNALLAIINDILDFSKMESEHMSIEQEKFNLRSCLDDILDLFSIKASDQGLELLLDLDANVPETIIGDSLRLRQILINLVNNALKFTSKGEVIIRVGAVQGDPDRTDLQFQIIDTGTGIPSEKIPALFNAFSQLDLATTRKYGGTGLGLAICKKLITLMQGRIFVQSEVGRGSTFTFKIPLNSDGRLQQQWSDSLAGKCVLLAENNVNASNIVRTQMQAFGLVVKQVFSKEQLLEEISGHVTPDLVISKIGFCGTDTVELMSGQSLSVPIIFLTKIGEAGHSNIALGPREWLLRKPVKRDILLRTLEAALIPASVDEVKLEPENPGLLQSADPASESKYPLSILLAEDNLINQKLSVYMLKKIGYEVDLAANGKDAIERMRDKKYDVILMDVLMPEMNGLEATRYIRYHFEHQPKIIAMTANVLEEDRQACYASGMNLFLSKPFRLEELQNILDKAIFEIQHELKS